MRNNDRVGLVLVADRVEHFVPPARGRTHLLRLLRDVLLVTPRRAGSRLADVVRFVLRTTRRRSLLFWISDFEDPLPERDWKALGRRHDFTALVLRDPRDETLPNVGWVAIEDLEHGTRSLVNTSSASVRRAYQRDALARRAVLERSLRLARSPWIELHTDRSYLPTLMRYFATRRRRRAKA
jgi:uncharacterized protein (DUF58 family)